MKIKRKLAGILSVTTLMSNVFLLYGSEMPMYQELASIIPLQTTTGPAYVVPAVTTDSIYGTSQLTTAAAYKVAGLGVVKNPSFDEKLLGWENPSWGGADLMFSLDDTNGVEGSACAKLENNTAIEQQLIGLEPNTPYVLSVQVKGSKGKTVELGYDDGQKKFNQTITLKDEYQQLEVKFTTTNLRTGRIYVYVPGDTDDAYVDNFSIALGEVDTWDGGSITIDPQTQYQTFDGWGTSLVWFANVIGGWSKEKREAISDLLFDTENGLGLNIVRYNIGGGDAPDHDHMRAGGELPGFATGFNPDGSLKYDWHADKNQITVLKDAIERGVNITEAFSNTPPYFMTNSGCASGSDGGWANNLKDEHYDGFADYLTEVVKHFKEKENIVFDYLEPLNEPYTAYWKEKGGQEGCHFDTDKQEEIIQLVNQSLKDKQLDETFVAAMDESILDTGLENFKGFSQETKNSMAKWNIHTYGGSKRKESKNAAAMEGKDLWMSEVDLGGAVEHDPEHMGPAIDFAKRIAYDMRHIQPTAWCTWQAVENWPNMMPKMDGKGGENSNWGLILANFEGEGVKGLGEEAFRTTKKYYGMMQYSKFIRPGAVMLETEDDKMLAFYNKDEEKLVIVAINDSNDTNEVIDFNLRGFDRVGESAEVYRTSWSEDCEKLADARIEGKVLADVLKRNSITTYVVENVQYNDAVIKLNESTITDKTEENRFEYTGNWDYWGNDGSCSKDNIWASEQGDEAILHFMGNQAKLYGAKANSHGKAEISVDGKDFKEIDVYRHDREENACIFDTGKLEIGNHTIRVRVTGTKNNDSSGTAVALDYAEIFKGEPIPPKTSITPATKWNDTKGERIQAHGGGIWFDKKEKKYYWYGEDKTYGYRPLRGVRCYTSTDLYNWTDEGLALRAIASKDQMESDAELAQLYEGRTDKDDIFRDLDINRAVMERPKVIYNEKTNQWVMWFHADGPTESSSADYAKARAGVAISDSPTGPFTYLKSYRLDQDPTGETHNQGMARDMNLFADDDQQAYIIYASEENGTLYISKLTQDYLDVAGWHKDSEKDNAGNPVKDSNGCSIRDIHYKGVEGEDYTRIYKKVAREAPAVFKYDGKYYLITSGCTGWSPNQAKYAMSDSMLGNWMDMGDPCIDDHNRNTFWSQSTFVIPVDAENGKFIFMADRWTDSTAEGLKDSRYIWLPIQFKSDGKIGIAWEDEWELSKLDTMGKTKVITPTPEKFIFGETVKLPNEITVQRGGKNEVQKVTWKTDENTTKIVGAITIDGILEDGREISINSYIIPENPLYFVACGDRESPDYIKMRDCMGENLVNKTVYDQAFNKDTTTWGHSAETGVAGSGEGIYKSIRYVNDTAKNRNLEYTFTNLEKGDYTVYLGFYDPWAEWSNGNRKANIYINNENKQNSIVIDGNERSYEYRDIKVADKLNVVVEPVNKGKNTDVQLSWLIISKKETIKPEIVAPQISITPEDKTDKVTVAITAAKENGGTILEYKLGNTGTWENYEAAFEVRENTTVYARAKDAEGTMSKEVSKEITNIEISKPILVVKSVQGKRGSEITVDVVLQAPKNLQALGFEVNYDPLVMTLSNEKLTMGSALAMWENKFSVEDGIGKVKINTVGTESFTNNDDIRVCTLNFKIKSDAKLGKSIVKINEVKGLSAGEVPVSIQSVQGNVEVKPRNTNPISTDNNNETAVEKELPIIPELSVDKDGNATWTVNEKTISNGIKDAKQSVISLQAALPQDVKQLVTQFNAKQVGEIAKTKKDLEIKCCLGAVKLGEKTLAEISNKDVEIVLKKQIINQMPAIKVSIQAQGKTISTFNENIMIEIPYELSSTQIAENIVIYRTDNSETVIIPTAKIMDGKVVFRTKHLSQYAVGYHEKNFVDINNHWAKNDIAFVTARDLFMGTNENHFAPEEPMTRAMLVTVLGRLYGADVTGITSSFDDVSSEAWYAKYVAWANEKGIVNGMGNNTFAPNKVVTREELAVIIANYAKFVNITFNNENDRNTLVDEKDVADWAKASVEIIQKSGIMGGKTKDTFEPKDCTTRAEVAKVLRAFIGYNLK